jgi:hypothetical protein
MPCLRRRFYSLRIAIRLLALKIASVKSAKSSLYYSYKSFELKVFILESFKLDIVSDVVYRFKVNSLALLLLTLVDLLTYVCYIREHRTSISSIEDQREFITGEGRLVIGGKGFVVGRREYITVCKKE